MTATGAPEPRSAATGAGRDHGDEHGDRPAASSLPRSILHAWRDQWRVVGATIGVGATLGLLVGGVGGRLAMRVLFLTSHPSVAGVQSDDGFVIGQITMASGLLLLLGMFFGVVGVMAYVVVRPFLIGPPWVRYGTCGVLAAVLMSPMLIHPHSIDFTVLTPRWLSVALFVALPGVFGALVGPAVEWAIRPGGLAQRAPAWLLVPPLLLILIPGPPLLLFGMPIAGAVALRRLLQRSPRTIGVIKHPALTWTARALLLIVGLFAAVDLVRKTAVIV